MEVVEVCQPEWVQKRCKYISKHPDPKRSLKLLQDEFKKIKLNLSLAVAKLDLRPGYAFWLERLSAFLTLYGLHITKQDHIYLVKLLCQVATSLDLEPSLCSRTLGILTDNLLRGFYLEPEDVVIEWRPLYDLYFKYHFGYDSNRQFLVHERSIDGMVTKAVLLLQKFFPLSATREILAEAKKLLVPTSLIHSVAIRIVILFLPTYSPLGKESETYGLWFEELMDTWTENMNLETNEDLDLLSLFKRLSRHNMGRIDWEPFLPKLYTRLLKYFGLSLTLPRSVGVQAINRSGTGDKSGNVIQILAELVVNTIDRSNSALEHLRILFKTLENYFHPSNLVGSITSRLTFFMGNLLRRFLERVVAEKEESDKWNIMRQPSESFLSDEQVKDFVSIVSPSALLSVFMKNQDSMLTVNYTSNPLYFVQTLAVLSPETILPDIFEKVAKLILLLLV